MTSTGDLARGLRRTLGRQPAVSLATTAALIAGIGVAAAVAGFLDSLHAPPRWTARVPDPDMLVRVSPVRNYGSYTAIGPRLRTLDVAVYRRVTAGAGRGPFAAPLQLECVSPAYLALLGVRPFAGRDFDSRDDVEGGPPIVVLAHHFWMRRFGGDPAVLGTAMQVDDRLHTIIGVGPPDFGGVDSPPADAWTPLAASPKFCDASGRPVPDQGAWLRTVGRVRPGFTVAHADAEVAALFAADAEWARRFGRGVVEPLYGRRAAHGSPAGRIGRFLAAGVVFMLLVVCVNVSLVRSLHVADCRDALAVRRQLGATRLRLGWMLWAETLLLAAACVPPAAIVALWTAWTLEAFFPIGSVETLLSPRGLAGLTAVALAVGGLGGAAPAVAGARTALRSAPGQSMPAGTRPSPGRDALLAGQVAAALVLIMVAQLLVRSTSEIRRGLGFDLDGVVVLTADLERAGFGSADRLSTFHLLEERVVRLPHVGAAALASLSLLDHDESSPAVAVTAPGSLGSVTVQTSTAVSPSYFDVVGTRLAQGRAFTREDTAGSRPVMIVSDGLARRLWPGRDATGLCAFVDDAGCVDVVGVSESRRPGAVRYYEEEFFVPLAQASRYGMDADIPRALFVRPKDAGDESLAAIAAAVRGAVPDLPFVSVERLSDRADAETRSWRLGIRMFGLFGGVAVLLAGIGVYGSLAGAVRRRTPEIAVRMALGARPADVVRLMLRRGAMVLAAGMALGGAALLAAAPLLRAWLFGVVPTDGPSLAAACGAVAVSVSLAVAAPLARAVRVDPMAALRC